MPDATTEWLVEHDDPDDIASAYEHIASRDDAIAYLRQLISQGKTAILYQRCPFTVNVDVTVQAPRKRKRKEAGAASPQAAEASDGSAKPEAQELDPGTANSPAGEKPASPVSLPTGKEEAAAKEGAERRPAPSPVCEASWPDDPVCPGPAEVDPMTGGAFCGFHLSLVPESFRVEMHRLHKGRNAPAPVVRIAG